MFLEGGLSKDDMRPLGSLSLINDDGYSSLGVKVFTKNFNTLGQSPDIHTSLAALGNNRVNFLRLRISRPVVSFVEELSVMQAKNHKYIAVSICFVSINGVAVNKLPSQGIAVIQHKQKESSLQLITQLCKSDYRNTLETLAHDSGILAKIQQNIQVMSDMLVRSECWVSPVFMALTRHNNAITNWLLDSFLQPDKKDAHAKMVLEIALSEENHQFTRLLKLYKFIMRSFMSYQSHTVNLPGFITVFCQVIRTVALHLRKANETRLIKSMSVTPEDIHVLLQVDRKFYTPSLRTAIIYLLVTLLYQPAPFQQNEQHQSLMVTLDTVFESLEEHPSSMEIFQNLLVQAQENPLVINWLQQDKCAKITYFLEKAKLQLKSKDSNNLKLSLKSL